MIPDQTAVLKISVPTSPTRHSVLSRSLELEILTVLGKSKFILLNEWLVENFKRHFWRYAEKHAWNYLDLRTRRYGIVPSMRSIMAKCSLLSWVYTTTATTNSQHLLPIFNQINNFLWTEYCTIISHVQFTTYYLLRIFETIQIGLVT